MKKHHPISPRQYSILLVDQPGFERNLIAEALAAMGFQIECGSEGNEALARLDQDPPDLVILDEMVKGLTPDVFLTHLHSRDLETFVLIISSNPDLDRGMDWVTKGAYAYLGRPIEPGRLYEYIQRGLENKEAFKEVVDMARNLKAANQALTREQSALKVKTEELRFLYDLGLKLSATLEDKEIITIVAAALTHLFQPDLIVVLTALSTLGEIRMFADHIIDKKTALALGRELMPEAGLSWDETADRFQLMEHNFTARPLFRQPGHRWTTPLLAAGQKRGLLGLYFFEEPSWDQDRRLLLENAALQTAQALFNAYQHESALNRAAHDPLTGLFNRLAFEEHLNREFERHLRYNSELALIMIDLDHFKSVNDRYGHKAGDDVLVRVARIIRENVRATDIAVRLGGEEFAVIMPDTDQAKARSLARRIEKRLRQEAIRIGEDSLKQTASQGVADVRAVRMNHPDELIRLADQAMYLAKAKGRNTIRLATDLASPARELAHG
ncbi:MAG: diguanylate cyclase [Thermodesulfobacteriota bacterium]